MPRTTGWRGLLALIAGVVWGGLATPAPTIAQTLNDFRLDPYPVDSQVGLVTRVQGNTAWIQMPTALSEGTKVMFVAFAEGSDPLYVGTVRWSAPSAPYEVYVTDIKATRTRYPANEYDTLWGLERSLRLETLSPIRPHRDGGGVPLAYGFYARTALPKTPPALEAIEPVRAHIRALRALKTKTATAIAVAAERGMGRASRSDDLEEAPVDYSALADSLRRFRNLQIPDPITEKLLRRLEILARENGSLGSAVAIEFLRSPRDAQNFGQAAGVRR